MKIKTLISISLLTLIALLPRSFSQQCSFNPSPTTKEELYASNCALARQFAPVVRLYGNSEGGSPPTSNDRDIPTTSNYDVNWDHYDNWGNIGQLNNTMPSAYYHVLWTDQLFIITYSYYYPRDWSIYDGITQCPEHATQHEGDVEKVSVFVERNSLTVRGWGVTNHGGVDHTEDEGNCTDHVLLGTAPSPIIMYSGSQHPIVHISSGSHAIYLYFGAAYNDINTEFPNCVPASEFILWLYPGDWQTSWILGPEVGLPNYHTTYQLVDVFDLDGLWNHKWLDNHFSSPEEHYSEATLEAYHTFYNQRYKCDNHCNNIFGGAEPVASAPWTGTLGMDIIPFIQDKIDAFNCCLVGTCTPLDFVDCDYVHNEFFCSSYNVRGFDIKESGENVTAKFAYMYHEDYYINAPVTWTIEVPQGVTYSCTGCAEQLNSISLTVFGVDLDSDGLSSIKVTATATLLECGTLSDSYEIPVTKGLVTDVDCNKIEIKYGDSFHVVGNSYDWSFPGFEGLSTLSNNDRTSTFNTSNAAARYDSLNNLTSVELPRVIPYILRVNTFINSIPDSKVLAGFIDIPNCVGPRSLHIYPNPSTDFLHVVFRGDELNQFSIEDDPSKKDVIIGGSYTIVDVNSQLILEHDMNSILEIIDISKLPNGIYFIYTTTAEGEIVSTKFTIAK